MREEYEIAVSGLYLRESAITRYAERELKLKLFPTRPPEDEASPQTIAEEIAGDVPLTEEQVEETADEALIAQDEQERPDTDEAAESEPPALAGSPSEPEDDEVPAPPPAVALMEASGTAARGERTLTLHRTLRSGSSVRYDGDVIIFGDVNPGAQVFASGNILVMGALKGMAHAGASGSEDVFILGFTLQPTQLRIGRKIAIVPGRRPDRSGFLPDIARIEDGQIVIEPYKSGSSR